MNSGKTHGSTVHFGGPDREPGALRNLLESHIDAVPSGGAIHWATYYFRDQGLARALIRAKQRGVKVHVVVEAAPHLPKANEPVVRMLRDRSALGMGLQKFGPPSWLGEVEPKPYLHSKIYAFSHPTPHVFVGSFNPSGNGPDDDAKIIDQIGDQDRGHNLLVELDDPALVSAMRRHVRWLPWLGWPTAAREAPIVRRTTTSGGRTAWLFPRIDVDVVESVFASVRKDGRLRVAMSHVKSKRSLKLLCGAAGRGAQVQVILHHTLRRAPQETEDALRNAGAEVLRYRHPHDLPMHAKFILIDHPDKPGADTCSTYGSLNLNRRSLKINHEVFVADRDPGVFAQLDARWQHIYRECLDQLDG